MFEGSTVPGIGEFWKHGEFYYTKESTFTVVEETPFAEYQSEYKFPPFWRAIKDITIGEIEIGKGINLIFLKTAILAMRCLILDEPKEIKLGEDEGQYKAMTMVIGDRHGSKANCSIKFDPEKEDELMAEYKQDGEVIICYSKMVNDGNFLF